MSGVGLVTTTAGSFQGRDGELRPLSLDATGRLRTVGGAEASAGTADGSVDAGNSAGVKAAQSYVPIPDASTIVPVLPANPARRFLSITNTGPNDAELWIGAQPATGTPASATSLTAGQTPKRGIPLFANGGGIFRDARVETGAIYATAMPVSSGSAATGLSVEEG